MGSARQHHHTEEDVVMQDTTIKQDALLRQIEALDKHIAGASDNQWSKDTFEIKRQQLMREWRLCQVIREKQ